MGLMGEEALRAGGPYLRTPSSVVFSSMSLKGEGGPCLSPTPCLLNEKRCTGLLVGTMWSQHATRKNRKMKHTGSPSLTATRGSQSVPETSHVGPVWGC